LRVARGLWLRLFQHCFIWIGVWTSAGCQGEADRRAPAPVASAAFATAEGDGSRAAGAGAGTGGTRMDEERYRLVQSGLFDALASDLEAARRRRYCDRDELTVALYSLAPSGFRRMQPILDEVGVTGAEVAAWVGAHPDRAVALAEVPTAAHEARLRAVRAEVEAKLAPGGADAGDCVAEGPRCERAFVRFLRLTLAEVPEAEREGKRAELHRAVGGFLGACEGGRMPSDFDCVLAAETEAAFAGCTFHQGLPVGWYPSTPSAPR
jgi:hypothetical protein